MRFCWSPRDLCWKKIWDCLDRQLLALNRNFRFLIFSWNRSRAFLTGIKTVFPKFIAASWQSSAFLIIFSIAPFKNGKNSVPCWSSFWWYSVLTFLRSIFSGTHSIIPAGFLIDMHSFFLFICCFWDIKELSARRAQTKGSFFCRLSEWFSISFLFKKYHRPPSMIRHFISVWCLFWLMVLFCFSEMRKNLQLHGFWSGSAWSKQLGMPIRLCNGMFPNILCARSWSISGNGIWVKSDLSCHPKENFIVSKKQKYELTTMPCF